jgi:putative nucleotidyltransferase with HDIG domain
MMNLLGAVLQSMTQLPPFPAVIQRVLQLVEDPKTSARDVVEVIQYDQSITANVLMVCNSAYFSLRRPVHSLGEALVRIGFNNLVEIILTRGTSFLFFQACQGYQLQSGELWRHSVACALLSQILADRLNQKKNPIQFTAALLHDAGKIVLAGFVRDHLEEIRRLVQEENLSFLEAEKAILGIDHAELGGRIAESWNFPPDIVAGIRYHHTPFLTPEFHDLVSLTYLSDVVAQMTGIGGGADGLSTHVSKEVMEQYALTAQDLEEVIADLEGRMNKVEGFLKVP